MMKTATFFMALVLQVMCKGPESCEIFPGNPNIRYGSDIIVSLKALPNSDCRRKDNFNTSRVYWTLNNQRIAKSYYDSNSTFASVFIRNFSLEQGVIECLLDGDILGGVRVRSYFVLSRPQNVSCVGKMDFDLIQCNITCKWDLGHVANTKYTVRLRQGSEEKTCKSTNNSCRFLYERGPELNKNISITVIAENSVSKAYSDTIIYNIWSIVQIDPPVVNVEPGLNDLRGHWNYSDFIGFPKECKVHYAEHEKPVQPLKDVSTSDFSLTGVKPCTNYTISVCCKLQDTIWSSCKNVSVLTSINVSHVQLWRSKSVFSAKGQRLVHLMWKAVPASCKAFDEYRLSYQTRNSNVDITRTSRSFRPSQNHTFITLDDESHRLSLSVFRNNACLSEAYINVPSTAEDLDFPPLHNVTALAKNGEIHVTWDKPMNAVTGYIIVWNSTDKNFLWQQSQETRFSLKGEPFTLYTISVSPMYEDGPGDEVRLDAYVQEGAPPRVSELDVKSISDDEAEIHWVPTLHTECCAFVVNYTVIYQAQDDPKPRNVTVDKTQRSVVLNDLRQGTIYSVYVLANSLASSSKSEPKKFSTKLYDKGSFITLVAVCVGLALLPVFVIFSVMIRRKFLAEKFPNPRYSSISVWSLQNHRMHCNPLPVTEKILPCQVDTEAINISPASPRAVKLKASGPAQEATEEGENALSASSPVTMELPSGGKQETSQLFPPTDVHTPGICPFYFSQSYRNQTPEVSPVESPWRPCAPEELEMLLKPKLHNATLDITYVAVDVFEHGKGQSK